MYSELCFASTRFASLAAPRGRTRTVPVYMMYPRQQNRFLCRSLGALPSSVVQGPAGHWIRGSRSRYDVGCTCNGSRVRQFCTCARFAARGTAPPLIRVDSAAQPGRAALPGAGWGGGHGPRLGQWRRERSLRIRAGSGPKSVIRRIVITNGVYNVIF